MTVFGYHLFVFLVIFNSLTYRLTNIPLNIEAYNKEYNKILTTAGGKKMISSKIWQTENPQTKQNKTKQLIRETITFTEEKKQLTQNYIPPKISLQIKKRQQYYVSTKKQRV